jgi:hypothetical protein
MINFERFLIKHWKTIFAAQKENTEQKKSMILKKLNWGVL